MTGCGQTAKLTRYLQAVIGFSNAVMHCRTDNLAAFIRSGVCHPGWSWGLLHRRSCGGLCQNPYIVLAVPLVEPCNLTHRFPKARSGPATIGPATIGPATSQYGAVGQTGVTCSIVF